MHKTTIQTTDLELTEFLGQNVQDIDSVLARYTYYGDTNLDSGVDLLDFNKLAANFGLSNRFWVHGDSTYEGDVNLADFNRLAANFGLPFLDGGSFSGFGEGDYTYEHLLGILMEMYPEYF